MLLRTNVRLLLLCALSIGATACQEGIHFDDFDGSFDFGDDAGDAGGAGTDAAVADPDEDGGAVGRDGGKGGAGDDGDAGVDGGADGGSDTGEPPESQLPAKFARALCDALADCYGSAAFLDDVIGGHDCVALNQNKLESGELHYVSTSIEADLVRFDADKLDDCTHDIRALGCDARASRLPASCKAALSGKVLIAGECTINLDCQGDAYCAKGDMCPGVCRPLQSQGFPCENDDDDQCKDGLVCSKGTCEALLSLGQSCGEADQTSCKPGLECGDLGVGGGDQCGDVAAFHAIKLGDDCNANDALCEPGLVCESVSGAQGVCAKPAGKGGSCKRAQPNQCPAGQYCNATDVGVSGTCVDAPAVGEACRTKAPLCREGNACVSGTCRAIYANGGPCSANAECYSGTCSVNICEGPLACEAP